VLSPDSYAIVATGFLSEELLPLLLHAAMETVATAAAAKTTTPLISWFIFRCPLDCSCVQVFVSDRSYGFVR
jgi:hypothetical protein